MEPPAARRSRRWATARRTEFEPDAHATARWPHLGRLLGDGRGHPRRHFLPIFEVRTRTGNLHVDLPRREHRDHQTCRAERGGDIAMCRVVRGQQHRPIVAEPNRLIMCFESFREPSGGAHRGR